MARTCLAVLVGLLVCSAAWAEEPHERWMKFAAGTWETKTIINKPSTVTWSFVPGHHVLLGTGAAADTGETADIIGWEPAKKVLIHAGFGKKHHWQILYTIVSDRVLEGKETGVMPDGRPYEGVITVRRVNDNEFTFKSSGNYTDGKKEKYEGSGTAKRINHEGKMPAAVAFQDFGNFLVGGVCTTIDAQGRNWEDRWEWILNKSFLQCTSKVGGETRIHTNGLDPETGRWMSWGFDNVGRTYKTVLTSDKPGEWVLHSTGQGKDGARSFKFKGTKDGPDKVRVEFLEVIVDGKKQPPEVQTWTRKK